MHSILTYDLMVLAFGSMAFGFYLLIKGGDWAIDSAVFLAEGAGLSKLFVGATILAFGTSVPELFASVNANMSGFPGISIGNVIGSNVANVLLVLGATALVFPVVCKAQEVKADIIMMLIATACLLAAMQLTVITRATGGIFFGILLAFVIYQYRVSQKQTALAASTPIGASVDLVEEKSDEAEFKSTASAAGVLFGGFAALALGSELLVKGAVTIGMAFGVPEAIIGMTVVAFGTSLPELATCVAAAVKKHTQVIVGNIIGSNVFNIFSIVGITALIKPIGIDPNLTGLSLWTMVGVSVAISAWFLAGKGLNKLCGALMVSGYLVFIGVQYV